MKMSKPEDKNSIFLTRGIRSTRSTRYGNDRLFTGTEDHSQSDSMTRTRKTVAEINSVLGLKGNRHLIVHHAHSESIYNGNDCQRNHNF
jgi:hypothetical protein